MSWFEADGPSAGSSSKPTPSTPSPSSQNPSLSSPSSRTQPQRPATLTRSTSNLTTSSSSTPGRRVSATSPGSSASLKKAALPGSAYATPSAAIVSPPGESLSAPNRTPEEPPPDFSLQRVDFRPNALSSLSCMAGSIGMVVDASHVVRLNLAAPSELSDVDSGAALGKVWLDPSGAFTLSNALAGGLVYLGPGVKKALALPKPPRGTIVSSVAFIPGSAGPDSGPATTAALGSAPPPAVLAGTSQGSLWFLNLPPDPTSTRGAAAAHVLALPVTEQITGLATGRFSTSSARSPSSSTRWWILVATQTRLYEIVAVGESLPTALAPYRDGSITAPFKELRSGVKSIPSTLAIKGNNTAFAWSTPVGLYHGSLSFGSQSPGAQITQDTATLIYPSSSNAHAGSGTAGAAAAAGTSGSGAAQTSMPLSVVVTDYHYLLLFSNRLTAVNAVSGKVVHETPLGGASIMGVPRGLTRDPVKGSVWLYTDSAVYAISIARESAQMSSVYLAKGDFEAAAAAASGPLQLDAVRTAQASSLFSKGSYELAARAYANTLVSFEEAALKFVAVSPSALRQYLTAKLAAFATAPPAAGDVGPQMTAIATWLVELHLDRINVAEASGAAASVQRTAVDDFRSFLKKYHRVLSPSTTFAMISSHGRTDDLLAFAELVGDHDRVLAHYMDAGDTKAALQALRGLAPNASTNDSIYKYSPSLMVASPEDTVALWMRNDSLNPRLLIPALMKYTPPDDPAMRASPTNNPAIRYLTHIVRNLGNSDPAIHNYLLSLYVTQSSEEALMNFLLGAGPEPTFDVRYALSLVRKAKRSHAAVHLYSIMGLHEEAVELALTLDLALAKAQARKPREERVQKKLWLQIAKHVISSSTGEDGKPNIKSAITLLRESDKLLKIEDILPLFPDFTLIDDFKEEITASLEDYNRHIDSLKADMDTATRSADTIRADINDVSSRYGFVGLAQPCDLCQLPVLSRGFYLFPCQHVFHIDCLTTHILSTVNPHVQKKILDTQAELATAVAATKAPQAPKQASTLTSRLSGAVGAAAAAITAGASPSAVLASATGATNSNEEPESTGPSPESRVTDLRAKLDDLVSGECVLCGDAMIRTINAPFVTSADAQESHSWDI